MVTTISDNIVTIKSPCDTPIQSLKAYFSPIQNGSGDPSPTNIRPITGWTGLEVTRCGKNLFDEQYPNILSSSTVTYRSIFVGSNTVTISTDAPINSLDAANVFLLPGKVTSGASTSNNGAWYNHSKTVIPVDEYITIGYRDRGDVDPRNYHTMIEFGTTLSAYEPYSGATIPVDWSSEAGTLYGGYVDLISGELVQTHGLWEMDGTTAFHRFGAQGGRSGTQPYNYYFPIEEASTLGDTARVVGKDELTSLGIFSTHYPNGHYATASDLPCFGAYIGSGGTRFQPRIGWPYESGMDTTEKANAWLKEQYDNGTPFRFTYILRNPIHYQLSAQTLSILRGHNNIFSNANGKCEVTYDHRDALDILSARKTVILGMDAANLYKGGDITFTTLKTLVFPLPPGTYRFSAVITSNDTDSTTCLTRFMQQDDTEAAAEMKYIPRSVNGEYHSADFVCPNATHHLYFYSSNGYDKSRGDTATYRNIRIERIG